MTLRATASRFAALAVVMALAGCTSYTYNCNVKDACPTSAGGAPVAPGPAVAPR